MTPIPPPLFRRTFRGLALLLLLSPATARGAAFVPDQGMYRVYQQDHLLGSEGITFEQRGDSLVVISTVKQRLPRPPAGQDTLSKTAMLVLKLSDGSMRSYQSYEQLNHESLTRILSMSEASYTSYRQSSEGGFGDAYERPAGRFYIVDPQVFALFDVLCRDLHAQRFRERPVTLLYVTSRDTVVTARVKRLGTMPFKFGGATLNAEKFSITDPWSQFFAWVAADGRMLRLTLPALGLRVDRDPASLKSGHSIRPITPIGPGMPTVHMGPRLKPPAAAPAPPGR